MTKFKPGDQVRYVPTHAEENLDHPDCENGFVVKENPRSPGDYFVRYQSKYSPGELRTKANSENTSGEMLVHHRWSSTGQIVSFWHGYVTPVSGDPLPKELE